MRCGQSFASRCRVGSVEDRAVLKGAALMGAVLVVPMDVAPKVVDRAVRMGGAPRVVVLEVVPVRKVAVRDARAVSSVVPVADRMAQAVRVEDLVARKAGAVVRV